jgi:hypothetical protein
MSTDRIIWWLAFVWQVRKAHKSQITLACCVYAVIVVENPEVQRRQQRQAVEQPGGTLTPEQEAVLGPRGSI